MKILSPAFDEGQPIPSKYTCDGENINPPLEFLDVPTGAKSLVLIMDDPDAPGGTFVHWLVWNLPPETIKIDESVFNSNMKAGSNDFKDVGYGGPCPPKGESHRYFFHFYALDVTLSLEAGSKHIELKKAMENHIIVETKLMGTYQRK